MLVPFLQKSLTKLHLWGQVCNMGHFPIPLHLKHTPHMASRVQFFAAQKRAVQSFATEIAPTRSETLLPRIARSLLWVREESVLALCARRDKPRNPGLSRTQPPKAGIFMVGFILIHAIIVHAMVTWETAGAEQDRRLPTRSCRRRPHVGHGARIACLDGRLLRAAAALHQLQRGLPELQQLLAGHGVALGAPPAT